MDEPSFAQWQRDVVRQIRHDPLWKAVYYRKALYLYDLAWSDCDVLMKDLRGREVSRQLIRSVGSICANIEEAYGRGVDTPDGIRVLRIALGECREARGWYHRSRHLLQDAVLQRRMALLSDIIGSLVKIIHRRR